MTFAPTTDIRIIHIGQPFLPFWAWSVLIHIGIVTLPGLIHFADKIERTNSTVQVTLVEATSSIHRSHSTNSKQIESATKHPLLINAQRQIPPTPQQIIPIPKVLKTPEMRTTLTQITTTGKSQERVNTAQHRVLKDHRATYNLNIRNYLKVVQRQRVQSSTVQAQVASNSLAITSAMSLPSIPMEIQRPNTLHSKNASQDTIKPNILLAKPSNPTGFSKSKAKFGGAIPLVYPLIAKKNEWEGTVRLRVVVQPNGFPETISIKKTSGYKVLDNAAIKAIQKTSFIPAKDGNIPVRSIVEIPIKFDLKNPT